MRPLLLALALAAPAAATAADKPPPPQAVMYRVTGLFAPEREAALREAVATLPGVKLVAVDFNAGEMTVEYAAATAFPGAKPDQIAQQFNDRLRAASNHTLGVKPRSTVPPDKLVRVEIPVAGLDCRACELAAYEAVAAVDGVEQATASFKTGLVTAKIDPARTARDKLEAALKQHNVTLKPR